MSIRKILFSFEGRIGRSTFFVAGATILVLAFLGASVIGATTRGRPDVAQTLLAVWGIPLGWVMLAVQVKRWHDLNKSGWMALINLIPFGTLIALVYLLFVKGTTGSNYYGGDPLQPASQSSQSPRQSARSSYQLPTKNDPDYIRCSNCGQEQWSGYRRCQKCGMVFASVAEKNTDAEVEQ